MPVDFDAFVDWAETRFGDIIVSYPEVKINSIFKSNDQDHKLWCNPDGGRDKIELGVYHCWKSGETGTLARLVMKVDGCSFEDALDILGGNTPLGELQEKIEIFFDNLQIKEVVKKTSINLRLPDNTFPIKDLPPWNPFRQKAEIYLKKRKIPIDGLLICTEGKKYKNRIVIPYYDPDGKLIYFNCRALNDKQMPKYIGPKKEIGVGKGDVVFMPKWPRPGEKVYLPEGELDALSLFYAGLNSGALGGKNLTLKQTQILSLYTPVIAVDNDKAGRIALKTIGDAMLSNRFKKYHDVYYVRPPQGFKDWNALLEAYDLNVVKTYVEANEKPYTEITSVGLI